MTLLHATILCLLPQVFPGLLGQSLVGKALDKGIWSYDTVNIHDFGIGKHRSVDAKQYGGGAGRVLRPDVVGNAIESCISDKTDAIYSFSPRGEKLNHSLIKNIIKHTNIVLLCGKFEGIDDRVITEYNIKELSIGDFIVSSGEICAIALLDACVRLLPGVINNQQSHVEESFAQIEGVQGILEYPSYAKPCEWKGHRVPKVLLSGNHNKIAKWRLAKAVSDTQQRRPDLINTHVNHEFSKFINNSTTRANKRAKKE